MSDLRKGLEHVSLVTLIMRHKKLLRGLLVYERSKLDAKGMLNLFCLDIEQTESEGRSVSWLVEFIRSRATEKGSKCIVQVQYTMYTHACVGTYTHAHTYALQLTLLSVTCTFCIMCRQLAKRENPQ